MRREHREKKRREVLDVLEGRGDLPEFESSREGFSGIVESLMTGRPSRAIVAMPNQGQVSNLPEGVIVETWAEINGSGIHPVMSGPVPFPLMGYMQTIIDEQETAVRAALDGDPGLVEQAMAISPMVHNKDAAGRLAEKMLSAQRDFLPQF